MDNMTENRAASELLRHAAWLGRLARALVGDAATADDVVQEAFVAALLPRAWTGASLQGRGDRIAAEQVAFLGSSAEAMHAHSP